MRSILFPSCFLDFSILLLVLSVFPIGKAAAEPLEGRVIKQVKVVGNRTNMAVLRSKIALKENKPFREADVERTKRNLYGMRLFKSVEIESKLNESLGGVEITIRAKDGWFVFPLPFFGGGGGGRRMSLMVLERNLLRRAESLFFFGAFNRDGESAMVGGSVSGFSLAAGLKRGNFAEREYADGGFNATSFSRSSRDEADPSRYATIINSYTKEVKGGSASLGVHLSGRLRVRLSLETGRISYSESTVSVPADAGYQNFATVGISCGRRAARGGFAGFSESFGAIFGLGLADVNERIKPLAKARVGFIPDISVSRGGRFLGSDFGFTRISAGISGHVELRQRHKLLLRLRASRGFGLPFTRQIATDRSLGLKGNYAREYRGDTGIGGSLSFAYILRKSGRGILVSEVFAEDAAVWRGAKSFNQPGLGTSFYYRFWRFPLPLGIGYTYSIEDDDSQVSFAIGGTF